MRTALNLVGAAAIIAATALPAYAMNSMSKGEGMMIMSNGQMATMKTMDSKSSAAMMKHPMKGCMVMMMSADGKMYMMQETDKQCGAMSKSKM